MASRRSGSPCAGNSNARKKKKSYKAHFNPDWVKENGNADSERVFSMVNKICTEHRADLAQDTVAALLCVKVNSRVDPQRFEPSRNELGKTKSATMEYNRLHLHPA